MICKFFKLIHELVKIIGIFYWEFWEQRKSKKKLFGNCIRMIAKKANAQNNVFFNFWTITIISIFTTCHLGILMQIIDGTGVPIHSYTHYLPLGVFFYFFSFFLFHIFYVMENLAKKFRKLVKISQIYNTQKFNKKLNRVSKDFPNCFCAKKAFNHQSLFYFCNVESSRPFSSPCLLCISQERRKERQRRRQKSLYGFVVNFSILQNSWGWWDLFCSQPLPLPFFCCKKPPLYPTFCAVQTPTCSIILLW